MDPIPHTGGRPLPIRVLCVDDNADMTAVMRMMIETDPTLECVGCLTSADGLIDEVRRLNPAPDVVLLDATMPGKNPITVMSEMAVEFPAIRSIVYTGHVGAAFIDKVVNAGAWGCVSKNAEPGTILQAVHEVAAGNVWWARSGRGD